MRLTRRRSLFTLPALAALSAPAMGQAPVPAADEDEDPPMAIKLVALDMGGTLIADHGEVPEAMLGAFSRHGVTVTPAEFSEWRGASKREMVRHFVARENKSESLIEPIYADFMERATKAYANVQPIPGAEQAIRELQAMKLLLATTTGFDRPLTTAILSHLGWQHYFVASISSDEVSEGRPAPFMLFRAMEAAHVYDPGQVIAVGDTPLDLQAATNGAMGAAIGVYSGAIPEARLRQERNSAILPSVAHLPDLLKRGLPMSHCRV
jgi:phosphonatase-like hydrolase